MNEQTLWIARGTKSDDRYYYIYAKEPNIVFQKLWSRKGWTHRGRLFSFCPAQIHKYIPNLKLKPGEKKQFTISVKD